LEELARVRFAARLRDPAATDGLFPPPAFNHGPVPVLPNPEAPETPEPVPVDPTPPAPEEPEPTPAAPVYPVPGNPDPTDIPPAEPAEPQQTGQHAIPETPDSTPIPSPSGALDPDRPTRIGRPR
jgi:hypothetical protein